MRFPPSARRTVTSIVCAALLVSCPGPLATQALAEVVSTPVGMPVLPRVKASAPVPGVPRLQLERTVEALAPEKAAAPAAPDQQRQALDRAFSGSAVHTGEPSTVVVEGGGGPEGSGLSPDHGVALARLVAFLVAATPERRSALAEAIREGRPLGPLLAAAPGRVGYWRDLINDFAHSQFAGRSRAIVELVTNAIDAVQGDFPKSVAIATSGGVVTVSDQGHGMSLPDVLEKLLVPLLSGKEGLATTGRFGVGFYSVVQFLDQPGHAIDIATSDGAEGYRLRLYQKDGEPHISLRKADGLPRGTSVSVTAGLPSHEVAEVVAESLRYDRQAELLLDGARVNGEPLESLAGDGVKLLFARGGDDGAVVTLNGVTIFSRPASGEAALGTFVVDFPVRTQLAVSRNMLLIDDFTRASARRAIDLAAAQADPWPFLNSLAPLIQALQSNNPSARIEDNLELYLHAAAKKAAAEHPGLFLPDDDEARRLRVDNPIYLELSLYNSLEDYQLPFEAYPDFKPSIFGTRYKMLLAPFHDDGALAAYGNTLFLNENRRPKGPIGRALLQALIEVEGLSGSVLGPWTRRDVIGWIIAPARFLRDYFLTLAPSSCLGLLDRLRARFRRADPSLKDYTPAERQAIGRTFTVWEKLFLQYGVWFASFKGASAFMFLAIRILPPVIALRIFPWLSFLSLAVAVALMMTSSRHIVPVVFHILAKLKKYKPWYGVLIAGYLLSLFSLPVLIRLFGLGSSAIAIAWTQHWIAWPSYLLFAFSLRRAAWDALCAGLLLLRASWLSASLAWRWPRLSSAQRGAVKKTLSWKPSTWALAAALGLFAGAPTDAAPFPAAAARASAEGVAGFPAYAGLPLSGADRALGAAILQDYDPLYFKTYLEMAGVLLQKYPRLFLRPKAARRYAEIWREDILRKDRESLEKLRQTLALVDKSQERDVPRRLRPYLIHMLGDSSALGDGFDEISWPAAADKAAVSFGLSSWVSRFLGGETSVRDLPALQASLAEPGPALRDKVARRALANSVNFQSTNPYIFVRELAQNSMDEAVSRDAPREKRLLRIRSEAGDGEISASFEDGFGMDFSALANFLLLPNASSKRGDKKLVGQYGHGFLTVLMGAREVLVKTSSGNGRAHYARLTPVRENGLVTEVKVDLATVPEAYTGTKVLWLKESTAPELDAARLKAQAVTFASLVDPEDLRIEWDGTALNKPKALLAQAPSPFGELSLHEFAGENTVTQRGLYVKELESEYTDAIPEGIRDLLVEKGVVVQLPPALRLTRDRVDIIQKTERFPAVRNALGQASLAAAVKLYLKGEVEVDRLFPEDFVRNAKAYGAAVPGFILDDVARLRQGGAVADPQVYRDKNNLAMLLGSFPAVKLRYSARVRGKVSLLWALNALHEGRIHWLQLPPDFSQLVVGKTLGSVLWKWGKRVAIGVLVAVFVWRGGVFAWHGLHDVYLKLMPQAYINQTIAELADFAKVTVDHVAAGRLMLDYGWVAAHNPFLLTFLKLKEIFSEPASIVATFPVGVAGLLGYALLKMLFSPRRRLPGRVGTADLYWAFSDWTGRLATRLAPPGDEPIESLYFMKPAGPAAQTEQGVRAVFWNLWSAVNKGRPFSSFQALLRGRLSRGALRGMADAVKVASHEAVHAGENPGTWTENEAQTELQAEYLERGLAAQDALEADLERTRRAYRGRFGSPIFLHRDMAGFPETKVREELWVGESLEPYPVPASETIMKGASVVGHVERRKDGVYETLQGGSAARDAHAALEGARRAGIEPALRGIVLLADPAGTRAEWFEWSREGFLFVHERVLEALAAGRTGLSRRDVLTQLVLRYALGPGRPAATRLTPAELRDAGVWPGSALAAPAAIRAAKRLIRFAWLRRQGFRAYKIAQYAGAIYTMILIGSLKELVNAGFVPLLSTPNLLRLSLLILPLAWPAMNWALGKLQGNMDVLRRHGVAPGLEKVAPFMRRFVGKAVGKADNGSKSASLRAMAVFSVMAFLEEYMFRYLMFHAFGSWLAAAFGLSPWIALPAAALVSALLFSFMHFTNWKDVTLKDSIGLFCYYGAGALFLTALYWIGGIWIATFAHMWFNTHDLEKARQAQAAEKPVPPSAPAPDLSAGLPARPFDGGRWVVVGENLNQRLGTVLEELAPKLAEAERRRLLEGLAEARFLPSAEASALETTDAVLNLKQDLARAGAARPRRFTKSINLFLEELPSQLVEPAISYLLGELTAPLGDYLEREKKAALPASMEARRRELEGKVSAALGAKAELKVYEAETLMKFDPGWGWPLARTRADGVELWVPERMFYGASQDDSDLAGPLSSMALDALRSAGRPAAFLPAKGHETLAIEAAATAASMEAHKPWLLKLRGWLLWGAAGLFMACQGALPIAAALLRHPAVGWAALAEKLSLFASNFHNPLFIAVFAAAFAFDWGTKYWINRRLKQVDSSEMYKMRRDVVKFGPFSFPVANVLHNVRGPRGVFTAVMPVLWILGGVTLTANPVFGALLLGGAFGNMLEVALRMGATDWIPLRRAVANGADFEIGLGMLGPYLAALPQLPLGLAIGWAGRAAWRALKARRNAAPAAPPVAKAKT